VCDIFKEQKKIWYKLRWQLIANHYQFS
jgi:hypothetical protein